MFYVTTKSKSVKLCLPLLVRDQIVDLDSVVHFKMSFY